MKQNYSGNKKRREEAKRKKHEQKRLERLNRKAAAQLPSDNPGQDLPQAGPQADVPL